MKKQSSQGQKGLVGTARDAVRGRRRAASLPVVGEKTVSCENEGALRVNEFSNEIVRRFLAKIDNRSLLHDAALVHQHNLVAQIGGLCEIMRDKQCGLLEARKNLFQIFLQRGAH